MGNKELVILAAKGSNGGGPVTADAVASAIGSMTSAQAAQARSDLGAEPKKFVVTVTYDDQNEEYTADKTLTEILTAYNAGKTLVVNCEDDVYSLCFADPTDPTFKFSTTITDMPDAIERTFTKDLELDDSGIWNYSEKEIGTGERVLSTTAPDITPEPNTIYKCGTLTSLTISNPPATGSYSIVFTSGSTETTTTIPSTILGLESFAAEANTLYEINVLDNRAVVGSWAVTP